MALMRLEDVSKSNGMDFEKIIRQDARFLAHLRHLQGRARPESGD